METLPSCSVVVTTCVDSPGLRANLAQVGPQARAIGADVCLIFNCAENAIPAVVRAELGALVDVLLFEPEPGKSNALNTAIARMQGEVIAFTDDDAIPGTGWLRALLQPFAEDAKVVGVGGPVLPQFDGDGPPTWYRRILARKPSTFLGPKHFMGNDPVDYTYPTGDKIDGVPLGANCAWRREALLRHPYPPTLGPNRATGLRGGEDTFVAIQIMAEGGRVVHQPSARVCHPVEAGRISREYVLNGHRIQATEYVRIMQHLGRPMPDLARLERYGNILERQRKRNVFLGEDRAFRRDTKLAFVKQLIVELKSLPAESGAPALERVS
ncbi:MAG: glycosyltransferase [Planctomycetota bacterium]